MSFITLNKKNYHSYSLEQLVNMLLSIFFDKYDETNIFCHNFLNFHQFSFHLPFSMLRISNSNPENRPSPTNVDWGYVHGA